MRKILTDKQQRELVVDHEDGFTAIALAARYGVSRMTVYRTLADHQAKRRIEPRKKRKPLRTRAPRRELKPCGTNAAYARHKQNGEYPCTLCLAAHAEQQKQYKSGITVL